MPFKHMLLYLVVFIPFHDCTISIVDTCTGDDSSHGVKDIADADPLQTITECGDRLRDAGDE